MWSEYAHLPYLDCCIIPDGLDAGDYSGSLVNLIAPYAFLKAAAVEGHKAVVCTAGNSATGLALLGFATAGGVPVISLVRDEAGKKELEALGAKHVLVQTDPGFLQRFGNLAQQLNATAVFDGVGGALLSGLVNVLPAGSTLYCYGYLGGQTPFSFHTSVLMKGITIKGFSNFRSAIVQNPEQLQAALTEISSLLPMPHFTTKNGEVFRFEEVGKALQYFSHTGRKAVLQP